MKKKITSLVFAAALCLSFCVTAFAAEEGSREQVYDLGNGITVTVGVGAPETMMPRTGVSGSGTASPTARQNYNMTAADGDMCRAYVWNEAASGSGITMKVDFVITFAGGEVVDFPTQDINAMGQPAFIKITSNDGKGLSGRVQITVRTVGASSAPYRFTVDQTWE